MLLGLTRAPMKPDKLRSLASKSNGGEASLGGRLGKDMADVFVVFWFWSIHRISEHLTWVATRKS
jgi:hypothetical protein